MKLNQEILTNIEIAFFEKISEKSNWGKNQIMDLYKDSQISVLKTLIDKPIINPIQVIQNELEQSELTKMMKSYFDDETVKRGLDEIVGKLAKQLQ